MKNIPKKILISFGFHNLISKNDSSSMWYSTWYLSQITFRARERSSEFTWPPQIFQGRFPSYLLLFLPEFPSLWRAHKTLTVYVALLVVSLCRSHSGEIPSVQAHAQCLLQLSAPRGKGAVKHLLRSTSVVAAIRWWVKWFLYIHTGVKSAIENEPS